MVVMVFFVIVVVINLDTSTYCTLWRNLKVRWRLSLMVIWPRIGESTGCGGPLAATGPRLYCPSLLLAALVLPRWTIVPDQTIWSPAGT